MFQQWSKTAASNATAAPGINLRENQAPSTVNDSVRSLMAELARWRDDISGLLDTGGASTAYTVTTNQGLGTLGADADGFLLCLTPHTTNTGPATLAVDGLTAKSIVQRSGVDVTAGQLLQGASYLMRYDAGLDKFVMMSSAQVSEFEPGRRILCENDAAPTGWTKKTDINDAVFVCTDGVVGTAGDQNASSVFTASRTPTGTVGGSALSTAQLAIHAHPYQRPSSSTAADLGSVDFWRSSLTTVDTSNAGSGQTHAHAFAGDPMNFNVKRVKLIRVEKN